MTARLPIRLLLSLSTLAILAVPAAAQSAGSAAGGGSSPNPPVPSVVDTTVRTVSPAVGCVECGLAIAPIAGTALFQPEMLPVVVMPYTDGFTAQQIVQTCISCGQWVGGMVPSFGYQPPTPADVYLMPAMPFPSFDVDPAYGYPYEPSFYDRGEETTELPPSFFSL